MSNVRDQDRKRAFSRILRYASVCAAIGMSCFCTDVLAAQLRVTVDNPRGGEYYVVGQQQTVHVTGHFRVKLDVALSRDGGTTFEALGTINGAAKDITLRNALSWQVTSPASNTCVIRISSGTFKQTSGTFVIAAAAPSGGGAAGAITTLQLADGSVTEPKLANGAVTSVKVSSGQASPQFVLTADGAGGATWSSLPADPPTAALSLKGNNTGSAGNATDLSVANVQTLLGLGTFAYLNSPLTTKGDLLVFNGTSVARQPVGTDGKVLVADSTQATGVKWSGSSGVFTASTPLVVSGANVALGTAAAPTTADATADVIYGTSAAAKKALVLQATAAQTANIFEVQKSTGVVTFAVPALPNVTGTGTTVAGAGSGIAISTGSNNTIFGGSAGTALSTGSQNTFVGQQSGVLNSTGQRNSYFGQSAGYGNNGNECVMVGRNAGENNGVAYTANANTLIGFSAGEFATVSNVTAVGWKAALNSQTDVTAVGQSALLANTTGTNNVAIGSGSMTANVDGSFNVAVGKGTLAASVSSGVCTAIGDFALNADTTGDYNTAIGAGAMKTNTDGYNNSALGANALANNLSGHDNAAFGDGTMRTTTGSENACFGSGAGFNFTGNQNTFVGRAAGISTGGAGSNNVILGFTAGGAMTSGNANIILGSNADSSAPGSSNEFVAGSSTYPVNTVYFGKGAKATAPTAFTLRGTGSSTNGTAGGDVQIAGGLANQASDAGGAIAFQTAAAGSGTALSTKVKINATGITSLFNGASVASAASIAPTGNLFHVTGTTTITTITSTGISAGTTITLILDASVTINNGTNMKLFGGTFSATANSTLTMIYDGTNWFEVARSVN